MVFINGHSYARTDFSTGTTLIDTATGATIANLEAFSVKHDAAVISAPDFWGVTFAQDSNRFYATLATGGVYYLVEGDVQARSMRTIYTGVECPSLSPDNTRVVYKKRDRHDGWRLHGLDPAMLADTPLAETRNVNDQVEWLNNDHVLYTLSNDSATNDMIESVWVVPTDGGGEARLFAHGASSPCRSSVSGHRSTKTHC